MQGLLIDNNIKTPSLKLQENDRIWKRVKLDSVSYANNFNLSGSEYTLISKLYMSPKVEIDLISTPENKEVLPIKIANLQNVLLKIKNKYGTNLHKYSKYNGIAELHKENHQEFEDLLRRKLESLLTWGKTQKNVKVESNRVEEENSNEIETSKAEKRIPGIFKIIRNR